MRAPAIRAADVVVVAVAVDDWLTEQTLALLDACVAAKVDFVVALTKARTKKRVSVHHHHHHHHATRWKHKHIKEKNDQLKTIHILTE